MSQSGIAIGVLAASTKQLGELNRLIRGAGYSVMASLELRDGPIKVLPEVNVWVVNLDLHEQRCLAVVDQLEALGLPVLFEEDIELIGVNTTYDGEDRPLLPAELRARKERRIAEKLRQLVLEPTANMSAPVNARAQKVWVLAASTGGPEAVARFLDGLPDHLPNLALLYVQHIEAQALDNLRSVVAKHCKWQIRFTDQAQVLREHTIYILSPIHQIDLSDSGILSPSQEPWEGRYRPSINQVVAKVARVYRQRGGVIVFSGMGDDGADSCGMMHHRGGQVWIQSPETCAIDSMPVSVAKRGLARLSAAPGELAKQFVLHHLT